MFLSPFFMVLLERKEFLGAAKYERALNFTSSLSQVEAKPELSRRQSPEKKCLRQQQGNQTKWNQSRPPLRSVRHQSSLFYKGMDYHPQACLDPTVCGHCGSWQETIQKIQKVKGENMAATTDFGVIIVLLAGQTLLSSFFLGFYQKRKGIAFVCF